MTNFSANTETLLVAAWLAISPQLYEAIIQKDPEEARRTRIDGPKVITRLLDEELGQIEWDSVCGPVYQRLLSHQIARVDLDILTWAIRGDHGICFKENHRYSSPDKTREEEAARSETSVLWEAMSDNERLLGRLKRMSRQFQNNVQVGAQILWTYFRLHTPLLVRSTSTSFLLLELLLFGLQRVDWGEIAASLLGVPYVTGSVSPEDIQEKAVLLATLKELVWQAYTTFGDFSQESEFSQQLQECCLTLADQCYHTHGQIRTLEDDGTVYAN